MQAMPPKAGKQSKYVPKIANHRQTRRSADTAVDPDLLQVAALQLSIVQSVLQNRVSDVVLLHENPVHIELDGAQHDEIVEEEDMHKGVYVCVCVFHNVFCVIIENA